MERVLCLLLYLLVIAAARWQGGFDGTGAPGRGGGGYGVVEGGDGFGCAAHEGCFLADELCER